MMAQSAMLWMLGLLFLAFAPLVSSSTSARAEISVRYVFIALGALCLRLA